MMSGVGEPYYYYSYVLTGTLRHLYTLSSSASGDTHAVFYFITYLHNILGKYATYSLLCGDNSNIHKLNNFRPLLPKTAGSTSAVPQGQQLQQPHGASDIKMPPQQGVPARKPKPAGKGTANISMKTNKAYEKWAQDRDGSGAMQPTRNLRGGGHGNENLYHF